MQNSRTKPKPSKLLPVYVRDEERDMQIYRLVCEKKTGITADELCTVYSEHFASHPVPSNVGITETHFVRETILKSLSRLQGYLLIDERDGCYTALSITEYMLKSQLKHAKARSPDLPEIEIVNGVIRVQSTDQVQ